MRKSEITVSSSTPMPKGYGFLRKGNPFLTSLCRRTTIASNKTLYVVKDKSRVLGLRAPKHILAKVFAEERQTRSSRQAQVQRKDGTARDNFLKVICLQFPNIPAPEAELVASKATKKRSGRVGRTGTLDMDTKVRLAVAAHIRHCHTGYDKMMERGDDRAASRGKVQQFILDKLSEWRGKTDSKESKRPPKNTSNSRGAGRKPTPRQTKRACPEATQDTHTPPEIISLLSSDESDTKSPDHLDLDTLSDVFATEDEEEGEDNDDDEYEDEVLMLDSDDEV